MIECISIFQNSSTDSTESLGVAIMKSRGFFFEAHWYWIGAGALFGFIFLFNFCFIVALTYLNRRYLYLLCIETTKILELSVLRFVQNVQPLTSLKLLYQKSLKMTKQEERLSYHHLEKAQSTKLHLQVIKLIAFVCLCSCHLVESFIWLTNFKLNMQRGERKLGEAFHPHPHL